MLVRTKKYLARGLSVIGAAAGFVIMLPLTLVAMTLMMLAGIIAMANLRHRLREAESNTPWQSSTGDGEFAGEGGLRPPIEGTYTVVEK